VFATVAAAHRFRRVQDPGAQRREVVFAGGRAPRRDQRDREECPKKERDL